MKINRRRFNTLTAISTLLGINQQAFAQDNNLVKRIGDIIREYSDQGIHRTGTEADNLSGQWLAGRIAGLGIKASLNPLSLDRVNVIAGKLEWGGRVIEGVPAYDCSYTGVEGVQGSLGELNSDADIAVIMSGASTSGPTAAKIHAARANEAHKAIIVVTDESQPPQGTAIINAEDFTDPMGPPVLHIPHYPWRDLQQAVSGGADARVIAQCERVPSVAVNVGTRIEGSNPDLPPVVVMTPRSGWWKCASERGGGIALFLEMMRSISLASPKRNIYFTANTGHELGHIGLDHFLHDNQSLVNDAHVWIHLGANFAADGSAIRLQYSSEVNRALTHKHLDRLGIQAGTETPLTERPRGEARNIFDGSGEFISLLGGNPLFHHPHDVWPSAIDMPTTLKWVQAFTALVTEISQQS